MEINKAVALLSRYQNRIYFDKTCLKIEGITKRPIIGYNGTSKSLVRILCLVSGLITDEQFYDSYGPTICHTCNNEACINIKHLYVGNRSSNTTDIVLSGNHVQSRKTHCPQGHEYTPENTGRVISKGSITRYCRICNVERTKLWRLKRKNEK